MSTVAAKYWFVVYTKPRNELKVLERLLGIGIVAYTPFKTELRKWSDRKKKVKVPLLPYMVLVYLEEKETAKVFEIPGVVRYLFENGQRAIVSAQEVEAMKAYQADVYVDKAKQIAPGDTLEVPTLLQTGEVLQIQGKTCIARLQKLGAIVRFKIS